MNTLPKQDGTRLSVATNAIGFALYGLDGREVVVNAEGIPWVVLNDDETTKARGIASFVMGHLDQYDATHADS